MAVRKKSKSKTSPFKGKTIAKHGKGKEWQFRFEKTEETEVLVDLFRCVNPLELHKQFGLRLDEDLEWGDAMRDIVKNILVTIARGSLKAKLQERKDKTSHAAKNRDLSANNSLQL